MRPNAGRESARREPDTRKPEARDRPAEPHTQRGVGALYNERFRYARASSTGYPVYAPYEYAPSWQSSEVHASTS